MKFWWSGVNAFEAGSYLAQHHLVSFTQSPHQQGGQGDINHEHEPGKILIILEHKCANSIVVQHIRLAPKHVAHDGSVALQAICLSVEQAGGITQHDIYFGIGFW